MMCNMSPPFCPRMRQRAVKKKITSCYLVKKDAYGQNLQERATDPCCKTFVHQLVRSQVVRIEIGKPS